MAMTILNNTAAIMTLGELNKNINKVGKSLSRVSKGEKIVGASDDASGYGISEQMRVQIRGLEQDVQNVQNGNCILNIAQQAVDEQVQIVKKMREIAMKSSDAACSQNDRDVLQSELLQLKDQLSDIAETTTYNGKTLLNGHTKLINGIDIVYEATEGVTENSDQLIPEPSDPDGKDAYVKTLSNGTFDCYRPADYSNHVLNFADTVSSAEDLDNQGFSLLCTACNQFVSVKFDKSLNLNDYRYFKSGGIEAYVIGINKAEEIDEVYEAMFKSIKDAGLKDDGANSWYENDHSTLIARLGHTIALEKSPDNQYIIHRYGGDQYSGLILYNGFLGSTRIDRSYIELEHKEFQIQGTTRGSMYTNITIPNTTIGRLFNVFDDDCVRTWKEAKEFINKADTALSRLLSAATTIGAQARRLEFMNDNIVTSSENTQAAESTIRDADMAKEITDYTKQNVLVQSAQAMLAQANQNLSGVLSLLR